jgi:putative oxidoreductase
MLQFLNKLRPFALLVLRLGIGIIFLTHGWVKVLNLNGTMGMFAHMGLPGWLGVIAGLLELVAGVLLIVGLFTRICALLFTIEMCIAILAVHMKSGPWWQVNNYNLPLAMLVGSFAIAILGPGVASLDFAFFRNRI